GVPKTFDTNMFTPSQNQLYPTPPSPATRGDRVFGFQNTSAGAADPAHRRYHFALNLYSDYDAANASTMAGDETWTISATPQKIIDVCLQSFDQSGGGVALAGAPIATVIGLPTNQNCAENRPPIDVILVLDVSGSMNGKTLGSQNHKKIEVLR